MIAMIQSLVSHKFDAYTRRSRIAPTLIVLLPMLITVLSISPRQYTALGGLAGLLMWGSATALLAETGRELGKRKEPDLYKQWKGKPTTRLLRHRDAPNQIILARRHTKLGKCLPELKIPTALEERTNPKWADDTYETCIAFLRNHTSQHREKFPLVFEELCNYGFRRNLWGMKSIGTTTSAVGTTIIGIAAIISWMGNTTPSLLMVVGGVVNAILLLAWLMLITPTWVKTVAYAYAERLLETCENL